MLPLSLGLTLGIISFVGFLINIYIVLVVVLTKQVSVFQLRSIYTLLISVINIT